MTCRNCESPNINVETESEETGEIFLFCCQECQLQFRKHRFGLSLDKCISGIDRDIEISTSTLVKYEARGDAFSNKKVQQCINRFRLMKWMVLALKEQNRPKFIQFHAHFMKNSHELIETAESLRDIAYLQTCNCVKQEIEWFAHYLKCYDRLY